MTNPFFPQWVTADTVLNSLIDSYYGLKVEGEGTSVNVCLLPTEVAFAIPEEDRPTFLRIYNDFMINLAGRINMASIFSKFEFKPNTKDMRSRLRNDIDIAMHQFELIEGVSVKDSLKANLGIQGYSLHPKIKVVMFHSELN